MDEFLQLLLDRLAQVPFLKDQALWNNQLAKFNGDNDQPVYLFPLGLVEVTDIMYAELGNNLQEVTCTVKVHVVNNSPLQGEEMDIYVVGREVNRYLNKYTADGNFGALVHTMDNLDLEHDNLYDYQLSYTTLFRVSVPPLDETTVSLAEVQSDFDLDVDNQTIRTGDNQGYSFPTPAPDGGW